MDGKAAGMTHIHLKDAHWCENCQSVINIPNCCPACGTEVNIQPLSTWIEEHKKPIEQLDEIDKFARKVVELGEGFIFGLVKSEDETAEQFKRRIEFFKNLQR